MKNAMQFLDIKREEPAVQKAEVRIYSYDEIYANFATQLGDIIDSVAPLREIRVKNNTPEWFDGEILDEIRNREK